jgi:hypothetical protein
LPRACLTRYVPPSGFGYPLDGLLPPSPRRFCFAPTALLGFTLRSFPLPQGIRRVSARKHPLTVLPAAVTVAETTGRPGRPRFLGFNPCGSPWRLDAGLAHQPLAAPLGFSPFRACQQQPGPNSHPASSHALCGMSEGMSPTPQSLNRLLPGPARPPRQAATLGLDNPSRVLTPARSREFGQSAIRAMGSPRPASYIAADRPALFERPLYPTGVSGIR